MKKFAVVMAGGVGERFWPKSRRHMPKQFLNLGGKDSLIQRTVSRLEKVFLPEDIYLVVSSKHMPLVKEHLPHIPENNIITEPVGRNTAPCIGLAATYLKKKDPEGTMIVLPADHMILDEEKFLECVRKAVDIASSHEILVTIGITPTRPETGYGYIQISEAINSEEPAVHKGIKFVEKPDYHKAVQYMDNGNYLWNSGIFAWKISVILKKIDEFLPDLYKGLEELDKCSDIYKLKASLERVFPSLPSISIDYGVMERVSDIAVLRGSFGWDDLGSWTALSENLPKDENGNIIEGNFVGVEVENSIISSSSVLIAAIGVKDIIIVEADGAVLVCHVSQAQKVKEIIDKLKQKGETKYL